MNLVNIRTGLVGKIKRIDAQLERQSSEFISATFRENQKMAKYFKSQISKNYKKIYEKKNKEKRRLYKQKCVSEMSKDYIRQLLKQSKLKIGDITNEMIKAKRAQLQLKRERRKLSIEQ